MSESSKSSGSGQTSRSTRQSVASTLTSSPSLRSQPTSIFDAPLQPPKALTLTRAKLRELTDKVDSSEQMEEDVEDYLLEYVEDYVTNLIEGACQFAAHRNGNTVESKDVNTHLQRSCNVWLPGFGTEGIRPHKRTQITEAHKQRMALIRKKLRRN